MGEARRLAYQQVASYVEGVEAIGHLLQQAGMAESFAREIERLRKILKDELGEVPGHSELGDHGELELERILGDAFKGLRTHHLYALGSLLLTLSKKTILHLDHQVLKQLLVQEKLEEAMNTVKNLVVETDLSK